MQVRTLTFRRQAASWTLLPVLFFQNFFFYDHFHLLSFFLAKLEAGGYR